MLLVVADDLGNDKVGAYGESATAPPTPRIDALAAEGVRFRNAYGYPVCSPTRAALLTGRYGRRNGLGAIIRATSRWELPLDEVTIPELLDLGAWDYATTAVGKWHLSGWSTPSALRHPNLQGFDHYQGSLQNLSMHDDDDDGGGPTTGDGYFEYDKVVDGVESRVREYATAATTDDAVAAIGRMREPWMLYVAYNAAHRPFHVPPGSSLPPDARPVQLYDALVTELDRQLGRLLDAMGPEQRARTLVVFVGDNGTDPAAVLAPRGERHAKGTIYEGGTNVPLVVAGPGVARGRVSDALVHVVDVLPTVAAVAGVDPARTGAPLDGISFAPVLAEPSSPGPRRFVYTERFMPPGPGPYKKQWRAVRDDRYKLVVGFDGTKFYDLQGRDDDGPARAPDVLTGEERARYEALKAELDRVEREVRFAY